MKRGSVGFYGKLPVVGDFISRRLPKDFIDPLDQWMRNSLSVSQDKLQHNWLDLYLTSPLWRFAFQAGVCGESAWLGLMMPSVDKVGRYFPFVLACKVEQDKNLALLLTRCGAWFDRLEDVALMGLEENHKLEIFDKAVLNINTPTLPGSLPFNKKTGDEQVATQLVSEFDSRTSVYSLWINTGSAEQQGVINIFDGLPSGRDYSAMIK